MIPWEFLLLQLQLSWDINNISITCLLLTFGNDNLDVIYIIKISSFPQKKSPRQKCILLVLPNAARVDYFFTSI